MASQNPAQHTSTSSDAQRVAKAAIVRAVRAQQRVGLGRVVSPPPAITAPSVGGRP